MCWMSNGILRLPSSNKAGYLLSREKMLQSIMFNLRGLLDRFWGLKANPDSSTLCAANMFAACTLVFSTVNICTVNIIRIYACIFKYTCLGTLTQSGFPEICLQLYFTYTLFLKTSVPQPTCLLHQIWDFPPLTVVGSDEPDTFSMAGQPSPDFLLHEWGGRVEACFGDTFEAGIFHNFMADFVL